MFSLKLFSSTADLSRFSDVFFDNSISFYHQKQGLQQARRVGKVSEGFVTFVEGSSIDRIVDAEMIVFSSSVPTKHVVPIVSFPNSALLVGTKLVLGSSCLSGGAGDA